MALLESFPASLLRALVRLEFARQSHAHRAKPADWRWGLSSRRADRACRVQPRWLLLPLLSLSVTLCWADGVTSPAVSDAAAPKSVAVIPPPGSSGNPASHFTPDSDPPGIAESSPVANESVGPSRVAATTGTPGVFSVETAETLPAGTVSWSSYLNKFSRAPGSLTVLTEGVTLGMGITNRLTIYGEFQPYIHLHVSQPGELSLRTPANNPLYPPYYSGYYPYCELTCFTSTFRILGPCCPPGINVKKWNPFQPAYVEDYPFAAYDDSDIGPATVGAKFNFFSETRGNPLSVSMRSDFILPTRDVASELARFGAQNGTFSLDVNLALSKNFRNGVLIAANVGYIATTDPMLQGKYVLQLADRMFYGFGAVFFTRRRTQLLLETTCLGYQEGHNFGLGNDATPTQTFGPRSPTDAVVGVRLYARKNVGLDIGYRYMVNLHQVTDRNGFVFKLGGDFHIPGFK